MLRFVGQFLLIIFVYAVVKRLVGARRADRHGRADQQKAEERFDTSSRDVADAEFEDVAE